MGQSVDKADLELAGHRLENLSTLCSRITPDTGVLALSLDVIGCRPGGRNALPRATWRGLFESCLRRVESMPLRPYDPFTCSAPVIRGLLYAASWLVLKDLEEVELALDLAEDTFRELVEAAQERVPLRAVV